ncbi:MAG: DUF4922 domain-containing protein [Spirochaetales bacterium]|jgi:ATP adenylyltransferase/5',5'''-P-1,P-4-tetraphosphate phosphorylase II|nr:DUF4922 domain-containing protein [Spirochaetales bacterium]
MGSIDINSFINQQLAQWPLAAKNFAALDQVKTRTVTISPQETLVIQFNPGRIVSSAAKTDSQSIRERPCFLCHKNRPEAQIEQPFKPTYEILVNPFPIFPQHLTIVDQKHQPQSIYYRMADMLELTHALSDFIIFYNGPRCGASAPDHFHFQAGKKGLMPLEQEWPKIEKLPLFKDSQVLVEASANYLRKCIVITGQNTESIIHWVDKVIRHFSEYDKQHQEPMLNLLASYEAHQWQIIIFPRGAHRPRQFFANEADQLLLSPASVDFGGLLITPREEDFKKLDAKVIRDIFDQVSLSNTIWHQLLNDLQK